MNKRNKLNLILSIIFFAVAPIILIALGSSSISIAPFNYNETLVKNYCYDTQGENRSAFLCFDDNKRNSVTNWDNFSIIFNRDCNPIANLIRTSKDTIEITNSESAISNVIFSEIQYDYYNYSGLDISAKMEDFKEKSIFVSDIVATDLSLSIGDEVSITFEKKTIKLSVLGIYSNVDDDKYLNKTYYEFANPVCFVSKGIFNKLYGDKFNVYLRLRNNTDLITSCYRELEPILSGNKALLTVANGFSMNDFNIKDKTFKEYQATLMKLYTVNNRQGSLALSIISIVVTSICVFYVGYYCVQVLVEGIKFVYKHIVAFNTLFIGFNAILVFIAAYVMKTYFITINKAGYILYRAIKLPLIVTTACAILLSLVIVFSSFISWKKKKAEMDSLRKEDINNMKAKNDKIVFVTGSLVRGGAEKVIVELANYYASMGRKVDIVILLHNIVELDLHENITVVNFAGDTESRFKRIGYWIKSLRTYFKENVNTTIISFLVRVNLLVLLTAKKENHYLIVSERNDPRYDGRGFLINCLVSWLYPKSDKIVFQTKECKELFSKDIKEKGVIISNPITIKRYAELENYKENYFVSAGRICEQKDQITMINAMAIVTKKYKDATLEIYGDGDLTQKLNDAIVKQGLQNNVFIKPNIKNINDVILSSTAYICSSLYEGMSNSLMEASFAGVPCLTTPCLGTDFIKESENGYFVTIASAKDLAEKIMLLLSDKESYLSLRKNSIQMAKELKHDDVYLKWKECIDNE